jgi:hypothetical protein
VVVARAPNEVASGLLERGLEDLAAGRWETVRTSFEEALRLEEVPEALEGLS